MTALPPLSTSALVTTWAPDALLLLPVGLLLTYAVLLVRHHGSWPLWRTAALVAAMLVLAWAVAGAPTAYRASLPWAGALSVGLTSAVAPLGLALADPVRLWEEVRGRPVAWVRGRAARVVMFPLLASTLSAALLTTAFATGWFTTARTQDGPWAALQIGALLTGLLVTLPLLGEELLPRWCGPGLRTTFAFADGLLDAVPGLVVLAAGDSATGQTLLAVAESVGLPMIFAVLWQWMHADEADARAVDARLDRLEQRRAEPVADPTSDAVPATGPDRPWWESDPRFAGRYKGPGA
ncbi:MAG: cytochrome c oxidase assembly protein [Actinomycetota bacterium]|nr:cytochrome c oxidase assembly protein [Actinomycetota bacterium]